MSDLASQGIYLPSADPDDIWDASTLALGEIDAVMEKYFPGTNNWNVEWRSVVDDDSEAPLWSLHIFVETKKTED